MNNINSPQETDDRKALERIAMVAFQEQKSIRRWRNIWRAVWLLVVIVIIALVVRGKSGSSDFDGPHTAVIRINGEIAAGEQASAENIVASLDAAFDDKGTKAVVLLINSPGGSPVQAGIVFDEIRRLEKENPKIPVYAVAEDICASGAYYIAAAADKIFVNKASMVGSIGVIMEGFGFTDLMKKVGVERRVITAGVNKDLMDPFNTQSPAQKAHLQSMINEVHEQFIAAVETGRGNRLKISPDLFSGLVWTGQTAIEKGLADQIGSVDYVAREVVKAPELVDYTQTDNMAMQLAKRLGVSMGQGMVTSFEKLPAVR